MGWLKGLARERRYPTDRGTRTRIEREKGCKEGEEGVKERGRRERARHLPLPRGNLTFRLGLREPAGKEGGLEGQGTEGGGW